jgi:hypothetical protein
MYRYEQRKEPCVVLVWHRDRSRRHMHSALQPHSRPIAFADIALADRQLNRGLDRFFSFLKYAESPRADPRRSSGMVRMIESIQTPLVW